MAKSRAEIHGACRERLEEKNNDEYLKEERERGKRSPVQTGQLSRRERIRRNIKNNETLKKHRQERKEAMLAAAEEALVEH